MQIKILCDLHHKDSTNSKSKNVNQFTFTPRFWRILIQ
ncbi:hypothetical protein BN4901_1263 [Citrobacter europaeus]|uniref:Uncharacterized protein n=1 Tax=Citrobacter europaeus TaxID=1914243 RepID=A0ABY0JL08_9ENTR|nr:hypothetical protein BN4901_1263 [Citrobacter europaeus]